MIAALFSLVACQATPEKPAVVKKDTERLIEQAAGTKETETGTTKIGVTQLGIPEGRATYETAELSGKLKITADAEVIVPDTDAMPIVKASQGLFTQEQITGMFNLLFPGEKPRIQYGQVETKADFQQYIMELKNSMPRENSRVQKQILGRSLPCWKMAIKLRQKPPRAKAPFRTAQ